MRRPPALWRLVLRLSAEAEFRDDLLDEFEREFDELARAEGLRRARRWARAQALTSAAPLLRRRVRRPGAPSRISPTGRATPMDRLRHDLAFAWRSLRNRPAFTFVAVFTLAIGIGGTTAIFTVVNGVFFKKIEAIQQTEGLVEISRDLNGDYFDQSFPMFQRLREDSDVLEDLAAFSLASLALQTGTEPTMHMGLMTTANYFSLLGLAPSRGRFFTDEEAFFPNVAPSVVITHDLWLRRFQGAEDVIGRTVRVNGFTVEIIGVAPEAFGGHAAALRVDLFVPMGLEVPGLHTAQSLRGPANGIIEMLGRLRSGVDAVVAADALTSLADRVQREFQPTARPGSYVVRVVSWTPVPGIIRGAVAAFLGVLMVIVSLVLAMACMNVAGMLLARGSERRREIAVRLAMGATRRQLVRQLLTESVVLFLIAGGAGAVLALWATDLLMAFQPAAPPPIVLDLDLTPDMRVSFFAIVVAVSTGVLFSLTPALRATRPDLVPALKDEAGSGTPARSRLRAALVVTQTAVTVLLLVGSGLFLRAMTTLRSLDTGWDTDGVHVMPLNLELAGYDDAEAQAFLDALRERVDALPGVDAVAVAAKLPLGGGSSFGQINIDGLEAPRGQFGFNAFINRVSPGYFRTLGLELVEGRDVAETDTGDRAWVAVINRAMAGRLWPDRSPLGERFYIGRAGEGQPVEVIGVVEDAKYRRLVESTPNFYYLPLDQAFTQELVVHVRREESAQSIATALRALPRDLEPDLPVPTVQPLETALAIFMLPQRIAAWVAGIMGAIGVLLAAVGIYGVTAFAIGQRTREIGIRLALGARRGDLLRMMTRQGMLAPIIGMVAGVLMAALVTRVLSSLLAGVSPLDAITFGGVVAMITAVSVVAILIPARRAIDLDPVSTLRSE